MERTSRFMVSLRAGLSSERTAGTADDPASPPTSLGKSPPSKLLKCRPSLTAHLLLEQAPRHRHPGVVRVDGLWETPAARDASGVEKAKAAGVAVAKPNRTKLALMFISKL